MARIDTYNRDVRSWTKDVKRKLQLNILQMTSVYSGRAKKELESSVKNYAGLASKIGFTFPFYLVFVHKGAGRGYGGSGHQFGGNTVHQFTRRDGTKKATNSTSWHKMATGKRVAKLWFNPVLEEKFPVLSNLVTEYHGDRVLQGLERILVK
ncbi:hypothetical protein [Pedobacter antarcticus]|uniref:hypothetical protein n=1 Tax=Pedobacter antarcticus TaxID=34086 RepID=UPI00088D8DF7|nr:hypothetical protein [Pedobacter antarcticus]SDM40998.1 hypothetical protein SAMN04488084_106184 [Pedobacter antarcticus]